MFAKNFRGFVAPALPDALARLSIAGPDSSFRIQHENCIVLRGFHQQLKSLFARMQRLFVLQRIQFLLQLGDGSQAFIVAEQQSAAPRRKHRQEYRAEKSTNLFL